MGSKRFYDQDKRTAKAVQMLFVFPQEFKVIIAEGLAQIAEKEHQIDVLLKTIKSLGQEKVLAMYKSKQKKREYDQDPTLHQAMMYLQLLPQESRISLCGKIVELMGHVQEYLLLCKNHQAQPQKLHVVKIRDTYVELGDGPTRKLLEALANAFLDKVPQPTAQSREEIKSSEGGMKIKGDVP